MVANDSSMTGMLLSTFDEARQMCRSRTAVLVLLMVLQSASSVILNQFEDLIKEKIITTLFLTTLVGAGGNAGNQSAVHVIRGIATKKIGANDTGKMLCAEVMSGFMTAIVMSICVYFRVVWFTTIGTEGAPTASDGMAVSVALFIIVQASVLIGALLPLGLQSLGFDPAHAGPMIQVVMDVTGVATTCLIFQLIL